VHNGRLAGYGVIRTARTGCKIGPLFGDSAEISEALFDALIAGIAADSRCCLDVPEPNAQAVALAEGHRMSVVFETARMYAGPAPDIPIHRVFGVTTFELG
jgi:hypothetical protein